MNIRPRFQSLAASLVATLALAACSLGITSDPPTNNTVTPTRPPAVATLAATVNSGPAATLNTSTIGASATPAASATVARNIDITAPAAAATIGGITTAPAPPATAATPTPLVPAVIGGMVGANPPAVAPAASGQLSVPEINKRARPAIVQITNNQRTTTNASRTQPQTSVQVPTGLGTGFIFDKRGYILTNNHVIEGATSLTVVTTDDQTYDGKLVAAYPEGDLAVVQITCKGDCPIVALGDSSKLEVGESLVAIGNALGLEGGPTVTAGVVSALGRTEQEPNDTTGANQTQPGAFLVDLIQTDAAINPGNSGGPLFNMRGEVVGINTLGAGQAEPGVQAQGIGFAISINTAKATADALINGQPVPRPFIGISYGTLNAQQAAQFKLAYNTGVLVAQVSPGSPAEKAGIQKNDVVVKMDGQTVKGEGGVPGILLRHKPGDTIPVTILRNGQQQDVQVTLVQAMTRR